MNAFADLTREIDSSRRGKRTAAFFDFDGTLLAGFSVLYFLARRYLAGKVSRKEAQEQFQAMLRYLVHGTGFSDLLRDFTASMAGISEQDMWALAQEVFRKDLLGSLYPESRALLKAHQDRGHTVVIVSSATQFQLKLIAEELEVEHIVCTRLTVTHGRLSGELDGPACYGEQKCRAAREFARRHSMDLQRSWFYTDGVEDLPLLEAVAHPRPINPDSELSAVARERGWPTQQFHSRGIPGLADIARTGLVYGSLLPSFLLGAPAWLLKRSRRDVVNLGLSLWGDFGSAVAGLDLRVTGQEHLWSHRPAVFIFNHQSAADALVVARLLRRDFTGLAKREMKNNPLLAAALSFADVVFVDRQHKGGAALNTQAALDKLGRGVSLAIAPEGQRSMAYRLGPFRKGAFHIAMQAGVPVVPIVIANSSDALPKSGFFIRPATVHVKVLPPIRTRDWRVDSLDEQVRKCRRLFLRELGQAERNGKARSG